MTNYGTKTCCEELLLNTDETESRPSRDLLIPTELHICFM